MLSTTIIISYRICIKYQHTYKESFCDRLVTCNICISRIISMLSLLILFFLVILFSVSLSFMYSLNFLLLYWSVQWRIQDLQTGAKVERQRHEDRGAEGAEGIGFGEGVSPPQRGGSGEGHCPSQKMFRFRVWKWRLLVHSGRYSYSSLFILPWTV